MTQFLAAAASAYVVSAVLRVHADEQSGLGEAVLAGAVSRWRWLLSAVAAATLGATLLMAGAGLGNGLGAGLTLDEPATIVELTVADLAFAPALAVVAGIAALAVAVRRPWMAWLAVAFIVVSLYLGAAAPAAVAARRVTGGADDRAERLSGGGDGGDVRARRGVHGARRVAVPSPRRGVNHALLAQTVGSEVIGIVIVGALLAEQPARRA